jgi:hypothetical protein
LVKNWLQRGNDGFRVRVAVKYPVIGIGAPTYVYLADAARLLETDAVIPSDADVANAIGAITSRVLVQRSVEISPADNGAYRLAGMADAPEFRGFQDAHDHAIAGLQQLVRQQAAEAGTSDTRVEILVHDRVAPTAQGDRLFIGRLLTARLTGRPDIAKLT